MNYIPKRVFLLECGKYIELSYEEFCEKKEETEGFMRKIADAFWFRKCFWKWTSLHTGSTTASAAGCAI